MSIEFKIREARKNLEFSLAKQNDPEEFNVHFSSFTTSARSVIQYIYEACKNTGRTDWYAASIGNFETFKKFKEIRDQNIHHEVFFPSCKMKITQFVNIGTIGVLSFVHKDSDGNVISSYRADPPKPDKVENATVTAEYRITIDGNSVELLSLCQLYYDQVAAFRELAKQEGIV
jgi:hypothetical protein